MKDKIYYTVSKDYSLDDVLFKTIKLPNGRIAKIMNRKVFEKAVTAAQSRLKD
jgi:hypothetical protein